MQKLIIVMRFALLVGVVILSSCSLAGEDFTVFPASSPAATATLSPSSTVKAGDGTPSRSIEAKASPPSSSYTKTSAVLATATWVPALSETEAEVVAIDLLRDNGGCRLPCFWGFIPRQTSQETLDSFFHAFFNIGGPTINIPRDDSIIKISVAWSYDDDPHAVVKWLQVFMTAEREVKLADGKYDQSIFDNPYFSGYIQYYSLPNLLSNYGSPSKAYLGVDLGAEMGFDNLLHLYLDYSESGWTVHFRMPLKQDDHSFIGCPTQAFTSLSLWSPGDVAAAIENQAGVDEFGIYKPFEEATNLSLEDFYQRFKDSNNTQCLDTPVDIWLAQK